VSEPGTRDTHDIEADVARRLRAAGCVFAEEEAALLVGEMLGSERPDPLANRVALERMVAQRVSGVPVEYVIGWALFDGIRVRVGDGVFVPRHRTELLVEAAASVTRPGDPVVDLCCGSGAIGLALAGRVPGIELTAADIDPRAVSWARVNLEPVGGHVFEGDLYAALPESLRGRIRTLVCNTPYVPTAEIALLPPEARLYEPRGTLDGGGDGLDIQRRVAEGASDWLAPGGTLFVETGDAQAHLSALMMRAAGLEAEIIRSVEGDATVVSARRG
jgi:release factor glutamine methyltransferase